MLKIELFDRLTACKKNLPKPSTTRKIWHEVNFSVKLFKFKVLETAERGRTYGFMPFPRTLAWRETEMASLRIWTRVADSIFYCDNCYAKCSSSYGTQNKHEKGLCNNVFINVFSTEIKWQTLSSKQPFFDNFRRERNMPQE